MYISSDWNWDYTDGTKPGKGDKSRLTKPSQGALRTDCGGSGLFSNLHQFPLKSTILQQEYKSSTTTSKLQIEQSWPKGISSRMLEEASAIAGDALSSWKQLPRLGSLTAAA